ncbi:rubredoxin [Pedobacter sp. MW01-1-1]|uniref:rubredoxin n=1 Tax=Pedobacter sp. MW01-1-1 TaxID=3383027 RepID=UPI003FF10E15
MKQKNIIKINLTGGIISTGDFLSIVKAAEYAQAKEIRMGTRQQMYLTVSELKLAEFTDMLTAAHIKFEVNFDDNPNIVSSYVTDELFNRPNWLTEGVYADILDSFNYQPTLKVNIIDSTQNLVPFFTGNINFISSGTPNYWYLYVRFPKMTENNAWPELIYSADIPEVAKAIETVITADVKTFYSKTTASMALLKEKLDAENYNFFSKPVTEELVLPTFTIPYYEGLNRYGQKFWLGVYRRDEIYPLAFLKDICAICLKTKIGRIYVTPWKSILIKGIDAEDQKFWSYVLGKHLINVRHASNELNWQVEDLSNDGLIIKRYLVKRFDSLDLKTHGLCFAIKTQPKSGLFGSVVVKRLLNTTRTAKKSTDRFDILYTPDFNPNSKNYVVYKRKLALNVLDVHLAQLSNLYYEQIGLNNLIGADLKVDEVFAEGSDNAGMWVQQCQKCFSIYNEEYGDPEKGISAGTPFQTIPESYTCSMCNSTKEAFIPINFLTLITN